MTLLVLNGAVKNVGDYLIRDRGMELLRQVAPYRDLRLWPRTDPLPDGMDADAIVLCGGPGLAVDFYPRLFPLREDLSTLPPMRTLALGWSGRPIDGLGESFRFSRASLAALRVIGRQGPISVRDDVTHDIVSRARVGEPVTTGCVAWYDTRSMGRRLHRPVRATSLAVTAPARQENARGFVEVLRGLRRRFPSASRTCVFHRGIASRDHATNRQVVMNMALAVVAAGMGYRVVDAAHDLDKIAFYRTVDLHVGYRVHAHLATLSYRRPSILVSEDGRGVGQSITLGDPYRISARDPDLAEAVLDAVDRELRDFAGSDAAVAKMEATWPMMRAALERATA